jgi:hypothetical protein
VDNITGQWFYRGFLSANQVMDMDIGAKDDKLGVVKVACSEIRDVCFLTEAFALMLAA